MERNVLVIGNGFDIAHGLKTSYSDFLSFVKQEKYLEYNVDDKVEFEFRRICRENAFVKYLVERQNTVGNWVDFEKEIKRVTYEIRDFIIRIPSIIKKENVVYKKDISSFTEIVINMFGLVYDDSGSKLVVEPSVFSQEYGLFEDRIKVKLRKELDDLKLALMLYLRWYMPLLSNIPRVERLGQIEELHPVYIISFNYTKTHERYQWDTKTVHIHGSLQEERIVLGYEDDDPNDLTLIQFKKYFQRIQYQLEGIDKNVFESDESLDGDAKKEPTIAHFYGLSMDKTDEDIIKDIINSSDKTVVYYYVGQDGSETDYENKVINLIDILGKKTFLQSLEEKRIVFEKIDNGY